MVLINKLNIYFFLLSIFQIIVLANITNRRLSIVNDWNSNENLKTKNGIVPYVYCPKGSYRILKNKKLSNREDGCILCPRGRYGDTIGLTSSFCSGACPKGKYGNIKGAISILDCSQCPEDSYGPIEGNMNSECTKCPIGTYNPKIGSSLMSDCIKCPDNYYGHQCFNLFNSEENENKKIEKQNIFDENKILKKNEKANFNNNFIQYKKYGCGGLNNICMNEHIASLM